VESDTLSLGVGRNRAMDAEAVFLMAMCRAHLDSLTSRTTRDRIDDSITLRDYAFPETGAREKGSGACRTARGNGA